jgi:hypothetical protein
MKLINDVKNVKLLNSNLQLCGKKLSICDGQNIAECCGIWNMEIKVNTWQGTDWESFKEWNSKRVLKINV